jgi:hypothetical protein
MLPEFNSDGDLPEGVYRATEAEVFERFTTSSARRRWLGDRLRDVMSLAKTTGQLSRLFLWGSVVTNKETPNDIDVLLIMAADFDVEVLPGRCRMLFDHVQARLHFHADVFWSKESIGEAALLLWLDTYQTSRDLKRRGIVEVILS